MQRGASGSGDARRRPRPSKAVKVMEAAVAVPEDMPAAIGSNWARAGTAIRCRRVVHTSIGG